jgi:hypothetical protein
MATKGSSKDKDFVDPYVIEKRQRDELEGKKSNGWTTSKIIREGNKKDKNYHFNPIVEIKIIRK